MKIIKKEPLKQKETSFFKKALSFTKKYLTIFIILFIFLFLFICDNLGTWTGSFIMNNLKSIATSFTPTTDLFDDGSEVSFVSYFFGMNAKKKQEVAEFFLPTSQQNLSVSDELLSYKFDGVISSVANGTVRSIGYTTNNEKYIEIDHPQGYFSRYIGLNFVGVASGEKVNAQNSIGLASHSFPVRIYVYQNDNLVKISQIEWKN